jgi:hypothetical protein
MSNTSPLRLMAYHEHIFEFAFAATEFRHFLVNTTAVRNTI